jgi:hypothetical protein
MRMKRTLRVVMVVVVVMMMTMLLLLLLLLMVMRCDASFSSPRSPQSGPRERRL